MNTEQILRGILHSWNDPLKPLQVRREWNGVWACMPSCTYHNDGHHEVGCSFISESLEEIARLKKIGADLTPDKEALNASAR